MGRTRWINLSKRVVFVTTSIEQGIMLPANAIVKDILLSCLARAQGLYPVIVNHFLVNGNHVHFLLTSYDPEDIPKFMRSFKTESAHALNRLIGRGSHRVWCERYDRPYVLTLDDVIKKIAYIYANPAMDNMEDAIELYPGLSTWEAFELLFEGKLLGKHEMTVRKYTRKEVPVVGRETPSHREIGRIAQELSSTAKHYQKLTIDPNAWFACFGITDEAEKREINRQIAMEIRALEKKARELRVEENKNVFGRAELIKEWIDTSYESNRSGKRMYCLCSDVALRVSFLKMVKALIAEGRAVLERWRKGDLSAKYPIGLYPPSQPQMACLI